jgi:hypothetical protein
VSPNPGPTSPLRQPRHHCRRRLHSHRPRSRAEGYWALALFFGMIVLTIVLLIAGGVMVAFQQTRSFAIGLLIAIAIGVFISGGVCVAALSTTG